MPDLYYVLPIATDGVYQVTINKNRQKCLKNKLKLISMFICLNNRTKKRNIEIHK